MKVIFIGTSSGAGKTTVAALYCRYLSRKGISTAPFKASNLSSNSFVTKDGSEIGIGQAFQAWASGVEPSSDMNPILLKPLGNGTIQQIVNGKARDDISSENPKDTKALLKEACEAFDRLSGRYSAVVCEGSGSPAELNLFDKDVANIGMMRARSIPAVLVGDIERGGAFAAIYGTWLLMPEDVRHMLKGFIINRFRGDPSILGEAVKRIEKLTGMCYLGTIPYAEVKFPEEDSVYSKGERMEDPKGTEGFVADLDSLLKTAFEYGLDLKKIEEISSA